MAKTLGTLSLPQNTTINTIQLYSNNKYVTTLRQCSYIISVHKEKPFFLIKMVITRALLYYKFYYLPACFLSKKHFTITHPSPQVEAWSCITNPSIQAKPLGEGKRASASPIHTDRCKGNDDARARTKRWGKLHYPCLLFTQTRRVIKSVPIYFHPSTLFLPLPELKPTHKRYLLVVRYWPAKSKQVSSLPESAPGGGWLEFKLFHSLLVPPFSPLLVRSFRRLSPADFFIDFRVSFAVAQM